MILPGRPPKRRTCRRLRRKPAGHRVDLERAESLAAYKSLAKRRRKSNAAPLRLAFCLAHACRKFIEVIKTTNSTEALAVVAAAEVYRIEERIRGMSAEERLSVRKAESDALMVALKSGSRR